MPGGEGDPGEHFAGILCQPRIVAAFLGGQGVIQHRNHQLGIPLQTDDGELAQGHIEPPVIPVQHQRLVKEFLDEIRQLDNGGVIAFMAFPDLGTQDHGVQHFHHGNGSVGEHPGDAVHAAENGVAAENVGPAVLAAEDGTLGKYGQAVKGGGMDGTCDGICMDLVVEGHIDAIMVPVEGHGLHESLIRLEKCTSWVEISVDVSSLVLSTRIEPSNRNIKAYIEAKYGFKVADLYLAQVRGKLGIKAHEGYNKKEVTTRKVTICPEYKEAAIMDALEYFGCI